MRLAASVLSTLVLAAVPASAVAQSPPAGAGPTGATGATGPEAPVSPPASGRLVLRVERVGPIRTVLAGARWRVRGSLVPWVAGQQVTLRFTRGGRRLSVRRVRLLRSRTGSSGGFVASFRTRSSGRVDVRASHTATPELATAVAAPVVIDVLPTHVDGRSGPSAVGALQQRLARLGYVVGHRGSFDARTARAVLAFRKVMRMARTSQADRAVLSRLARGRGAFRARFPNHGRHVEGDIGRQVVVLVGAAGHVERIYPVSSGKASTPTIRGSFRVYRKDFGTNQHGMVHAAYFSGGYAIHGYVDVPTYNASHGCLRVPIPEALSIFRWVHYGTRVDTYA